jgi:EAL domain-containing protein (putative c-di-GMP-specific phosphodiesterase class I)
VKFCIRTLIEGKQFEHVYQPIWDLKDWTTFGYEAFIRIENVEVQNVEDLFQLARKEGCLYELDTAAIENSISNFPFFEFNKQLLFLNVYPSTIIHQQFVYFLDHLLDKYPVARGRIVFELNMTNEEQEIWDDSTLKEKIATIKKHGFYIAIDDSGEGKSTFQKIIEFQPNYIKLHRHFAKELAMSQEKQKMVSLFANYCYPQGGLVLEGIEKEIDLAQAKLLKVPIAQGYLLGEPEKLKI